MLRATLCCLSLQQSSECEVGVQGLDCCVESIFGSLKSSDAMGSGGASSISPDYFQIGPSLAVSLVETLYCPFPSNEMSYVSSLLDYIVITLIKAMYVRMYVYMYIIIKHVAMYIHT